MNVYFVYKVLTNRIRALIRAAGYIGITNSHVATIKYHMHYPIFMACTGGAVISLTSYPYTASLNPGKLPGRFSYERPGYEARYTLMRFRLIKNGVVTLMTFTLFRGVCSDKILHPYVAQLAKMWASVCCLCGSLA